MKKNKICILGWIGNDNLGDEMMLTSICNLLPKKYELTVFSKNPQKTQKLHKIKAIHIKKYFKCYLEIIKSKYIVFGGGSLIHDYQTIFHLLHWYSYLFVAIIFRTKIIILGQTIGDINKKSTLVLTKIILKNSEIIYLRDKKSYNITKHLVRKKDAKIFYGYDLMQYLNIPLDKRYISSLKKPYVFISLRDIHLEKWQGKKYSLEDKKNFAEKISTFINMIIREYNFNIILFPMQTSRPYNDYNINKVIYEQVKNKDKIITYSPTFGDISEAVSLIEHSEIAICARYHAMIMATNSNKPFLPLSYGTKNENLVSEIYNLSKYEINAYDFSSKEIKNKFEKLMMNKEKEKKGLEEFSKRKKQEKEKLKGILKDI